MFEKILNCGLVLFSLSGTLYADPAFSGGPPAKKTTSDQSAQLGGPGFGQTSFSNTAVAGLIVPGPKGISAETSRKSIPGPGLDLSAKAGGESLSSDFLNQSTNRPAPKSDLESLFYDQDAALSTNTVSLELFSTEPKK